MARALSPREQRFIEEYLKSSNATAAYKLAGYTAKTDQVAGVCASQLLTRPRVSEELSRRREAVSRKTDLTVEWFDRELLATYRAALEDGDGSTRAATLRLAGQRLKVLTERHEVEGKVTLAQIFEDIASSGNA